jgi:hypothetical protein
LIYLIEATSPRIFEQKTHRNSNKEKETKGSNIFSEDIV